MFDRPHVGKIRGIPVQIDASFALLCPILVAFAYQYFGNRSTDHRWTHTLTIAIIATALFLCCLVLHELGHAAAAVGYGLRVRSMRFFIFGGFTSIDGASLNSAAQELRIALAGPAVTFAIAILFMSISGLGRAGSNFALLTSLIGRINLFLAFVNLAPIFPFDGGLALRALLWKMYSDYSRATHSVVMFATTVAHGLIFIGLCACALNRLMWGIVLVIIGWRLRNLLSGIGRFSVG